MTDQKQENKKLGLIKKILKWIGKGILTLLLILSLIFQAPWKIIALLAVFFAACFILPKRMRKWFWRSVSAVVLILFIWVFLPEDDTGWRPYTFDEEIAAFRAKYAVPDEENAAFAYGEIFESLDIDTNQPEFFVRSSPSSQDEPWTSKDHPEMADWLKGHQDTIEKLMQASRKEKCVFSINFDPFQLPNNSTDFSNSRNCFYLLIVTANNDIA